MSYEMPLAELLAGVAKPPMDVSVGGLTIDSRQVTPGDAFVALSGAQAHGLQFAEQAMAAGCVVVLYDPKGVTALPDPVDRMAVPVVDLALHLGLLADRLYRQPSDQLITIGVTGTNGKSSFVHLLSRCLQALGKRAGTLGTLGYGLVDRARPAPLTTPDVATVHSELAKIRDSQGDVAVMEVSSHALDQGRVSAVRFAGAVFTNLSRDHLDYHQTMDAYGAAKATLFAWPGLRFAVINADEEFASHLRSVVADDVQLIDFGINQGTVRAAAIVSEPAGLRFELSLPDGKADVRSSLVGHFNVANLLAVAATLHVMGMSAKEIAVAISTVRCVPGRMETFGGDQHALVVVDYAHTPDALQAALTALRDHCDGRLVCVFGCGGDRDVGKRPLMGQVAEQFADGVIVTDDNPRSEDGDAIVIDILAGLAKPEQALVERDRAAAIQAAIATSEVGDVVLIAGKGHEDYQEIGGQRMPFDDRLVVRELLELAA